MENKTAPTVVDTITENVGESSSTSLSPKLEHPEWKWDDDSQNPYNWPKWKKNVSVATIAVVAFTWSVPQATTPAKHSCYLDAHAKELPAEIST